MDHMCRGMTTNHGALMWLFESRAADSVEIVRRIRLHNFMLECLGELVVVLMHRHCGGS